MSNDKSNEFHPPVPTKIFEDGLCRVIADPDNVQPTPHLYVFRSHNTEDPTGLIQFQQGPRNEEGSIPGVSSAAVIAMLVHHLNGFQQGDMRNRETALAITKLEEAALWLDKRTRERKERGVLGTKQK